MKHKPTKIYILLTLLIFTTLICCSCKQKAKKFSDKGLTITLNKDFETTSKKGFDIYIVSNDVVFSAVSRDAAELEYFGYEIDSLHDYSQEIAALNKGSKLKTRNDYYYFVSKDIKHGASYTYVHCMFYANGKYWVCEFVTKTKDYDEYKDDIFKWADSIKFEKETVK